MRYRFPVNRRSCEISASGASLATDAISGRVLAQRAHWTATARFHVPQSGQNRRLPSELQANEVVGRPRAGEREMQRRCPPGFPRNSVGELAPL